MNRDPEIPFVDAHVHLWDLSHNRYPFLPPSFTNDGPNDSIEATANAGQGASSGGKKVSLSDVLKERK
jgi:predicted TIM-barrel fold metal-dependent hydrolase